MKRHLSVLEQYTLRLLFAVRVYRWLLVPEVLRGDGTDPSGSKQGKSFSKICDASIKEPLLDVTGGRKYLMEFQ